MKKGFIATIFLLAALSSVSALEWGGLFNNMTNVSTSGFKKFPVNQSNGLFFWVKSSLNEDKTLNISSEAMYKYNWLIDGDTNPFSNILDLNLLKFSGSWKFGGNSLTVDAGRFNYSDIAAAVFLQNSDGAVARLSNMDFNTGLYVGYTGLLNRFTVGMTEAREPKFEQLYDLCYGYVPLLADFTFSNIGENAIGLQASYFFDVTGGKKDSGYFEVTGRGPMGNIGSYNASLVAGTERFTNFMLFSNFDLSFYITDDILVSTGAEYASGTNGLFSAYKPVTFRPVHNSPSVLQGADVIVPRVTGMFIFYGVCLTANEKVVMSISDDGFKVNGFDTSISGVYNIFSDLQVSCNIGAYVDLVDPEFNNFSFMLNANFTF